MHKLGAVGTDGSGGSEIWQRFRIVAAGAFVYSPQEGTYDTMHTRVPGHQTVPRAEAYALFQLLLVHQPAHTITYYIDASYVIRATSTKSNIYSSGSNGDIWTRIFTILEALGERAKFVKVKSHVKTDEEWHRHQMTFQAALLNCWADNVAEAAAARYADEHRNSEQASRDNSTLHTATAILTRAAIIEHSLRQYHDSNGFPLAARAEHVIARIQEKANTELQAATSNIGGTSGHILVRQGEWIRCRICGAKSLHNNHRYWASRICTRKRKLESSESAPNFNQAKARKAQFIATLINNNYDPEHHDHDDNNDDGMESHDYDDASQHVCSICRGDNTECDIWRCHNCKAEPVCDNCERNYQCRVCMRVLCPNWYMSHDLETCRAPNAAITHKPTTTFTTSNTTAGGFLNDGQGDSSLVEDGSVQLPTNTKRATGTTTTTESATTTTTDECTNARIDGRSSDEGYGDGMMHSTGTTCFTQHGNDDIHNLHTNSATRRKASTQEGHITQRAKRHQGEHMSGYHNTGVTTHTYGHRGCEDKAHTHDHRGNDEMSHMYGNGCDGDDGRGEDDDGTPNEGGGPPFTESTGDLVGVRAMRQIGSIIRTADAGMVTQTEEPRCDEDDGRTSHTEGRCTSYDDAHAQHDDQSRCTSPSAHTTSLAQHHVDAHQDLTTDDDQHDALHSDDMSYRHGTALSNHHNHDNESQQRSNKRRRANYEITNAVMATDIGWGPNGESSQLTTFTTTQRNGLLASGSSAEHDGRTQGNTFNTTTKANWGHMAEGMRPIADIDDENARPEPMGRQSPHSPGEDTNSKQIELRLDLGIEDQKRLHDDGSTDGRQQRRPRSGTDKATDTNQPGIRRQSQRAASYNYHTSDDDPPATQPEQHTQQQEQISLQLTRPPELSRVILGEGNIKHGNHANDHNKHNAYLNDYLRTPTTTGLDPNTITTQVPNNYHDFDHAPMSSIIEGKGCMGTLDDPEDSDVGMIGRHQGQFGPKANDLRPTIGPLQTHDAGHDWNDQQATYHYSPPTSTTPNPTHVHCIPTHGTSPSSPRGTNNHGEALGEFPLS